LRTRAISGDATAGNVRGVALANCLLTDLVGDWVYVTGDKIGARYQVQKVDPTDVAKMPVAGVIVSKTSSTECVVQIGGIARGLYSGLTPGVLQLVGLDARPTESLARPAAGVRVRQVVAVTLSATDIAVLIQTPVIAIPFP
jgi:hypothetical protein